MITYIKLRCRYRRPPKGRNKTAEVRFECAQELTKGTEGKREKECARRHCASFEELQIVLEFMAQRGKNGESDLMQSTN